MSEDQQKSMFKLCGLWKSQTKDGKVYYSGGLSYGTNLMLFPNTYKKSPDDKQPDLIIYIAKKEKKPKPGEGEEGSKPREEVEF